VTTSAGLHTRPLRIGFVGAGMISLYHLRAWAEVADAYVVAICDPNEKAARARSAEFQIPKTYPDLETMLAHEQVDAVDIATPVGTHAGLVCSAADLGVHVMCQKPLTPTVVGAEALIEYVGERVRFMVHENYRFRPHYSATRKWIANGRIGRPLQARLVMRCSGMCAVGGTKPWLIARQPYLAEMPRLLIFETLIHHLDTLRSFLGELKVESCLLSRINSDLAGEDTAVVTLRGEGDLVAILDGTFSAPGYSSNLSDRLEIVGDKATLIYDGERLSVVGAENEGLRFPSDPNGEGQECFTASVRDFVTGLLTGTSFATDRLDNVRTLRLMESCYDLARRTFQ
jgi:predicted dehydrogenase